MFNSFFHFFLDEWLKTCVYFIFSHHRAPLFCKLIFIFCVPSGHKKILLAGEPCVQWANTFERKNENKSFMVVFEFLLVAFPSFLSWPGQTDRQTDDHKTIKCNCLHLTAIIEFQNHCSEIERNFHADNSDKFPLYITQGSNKISDDKKFIKSLQQAIQNNIDQEGVIQNVRKSFKDLKEGKTSPSDNPFSTLHIH